MAPTKITSATPAPTAKPLPDNAIGPQVPIRALRMAHALTLPELVERIRGCGVEVTVAHLSNVELGYKRGGTALMAAWARALGLRPIDVAQPAARGALTVDRESA